VATERDGLLRRLLAIKDKIRAKWKPLDAKVLAARKTMVRAMEECEPWRQRLILLRDAEAELAGRRAWKPEREAAKLAEIEAVLRELGTD
jgi:hypothetical protein